MPTSSASTHTANRALAKVAVLDSESSSPRSRRRRSKSRSARSAQTCTRQAPMRNRRPGAMRLIQPARSAPRVAGSCSRTTGRGSTQAARTVSVRGRRNDRTKVNTTWPTNARPKKWRAIHATSGGPSASVGAIHTLSVTEPLRYARPISLRRGAATSAKVRGSGSAWVSSKNLSRAEGVGVAAGDASKDPSEGSRVMSGRGPRRRRQPPALDLRRWGAWGASESHSLRARASTQSLRRRPCATAAAKAARSTRRTSLTSRSQGLRKEATYRSAPRRPAGSRSLGTKTGTSVSGMVAMPSLRVRVRSVLSRS
mmetsp:Transcript_7072/g.20807  ORF Transcript_7072/g.20807 Transcript_7072/m.20807 type:complete len:312 (-) Transcript_7072:441-1376(-)